MPEESELNKPSELLNTFEMCKYVGAVGVVDERTVRTSISQSVDRCLMANMSVRVQL